MLDFGVVHLVVHMHPMNLLKFWLMKKIILEKMHFYFFISVGLYVCQVSWRKYPINVQMGHIVGGT